MHNKIKPVRKRSRLTETIAESCRRWDCSIGMFAEWAFEGSLNGLLQVGTAGNRTRYPSGMYEVHEKSGSFLRPS